MRILDWECVVNHDGTVRVAKHAENGTAMWSAGRLMGHADVPREVFAWLIRPQLRQAWESGCVIGLGAPTIMGTQPAIGSAYDLNPYNGEPPNKDKDVS